MPPAITCSSCSETLPENASFCHRCGARTPTGTHSASGQTEYAPPVPDSERDTAERRRALQRAVGDSCEVRELLGRGGFAEVYVGWEKRLKREVAIKTLRADLASPSLLDRFQREAEAVAKLRHPHIIPIYGVGEGEGVAYFTMPRIAGESLAALLEREGRPSVGEACRILREAAGALDEAHRHGLVHRDVKPENIMLEGRDRRALVMDFGIAKSAEGGETALTATGMVMGTPQYMSPEQAVGDRTIDHRTDQYSLAMVGYRMLTGRLPFESKSVQTILAKQITEAVTPLRQVAPDVSESVAAVIEKALAKRPEDRFGSMADFGAALSAATEMSQPSGRVRRSVPDIAARIAQMRAFLPGRKHPLALAGFAAAIIFLLLTPRTVPTVAYETAAQRDEAVFAMRSHLAARGITGALAHDTDFEDRMQTYRFLREAVGRDSLYTLARSGAPVWQWHIVAKQRGGGPIFHVDVGPDNRITRFEEKLRDTARAVTAEPAVAESIAVAELTSRGWDASALQRRPDSVITRRNRVDRVYTWVRPEIAIPWQESDTAFGTVRVRVSGDRVIDYQEQLVLPPAYGSRGFTTLVAITIFGWLLGAGLLVYALALAIARQRHDTLQWRASLIVASTALVFLCLGLAPDLVEDVRFAPGSTSQAVVQVIATAVFMGLLLGILIVFTYVSGESLASEHRPRAVDGVADLLRGRFVIPEMATAAAVGVALGAIAVAVHAVSAFLLMQKIGAPLDPETARILERTIPLPELLLAFTLAIAAAVAMLFVQMVVTQWKPSAVLATLVPLAIVSMVLIGMNMPATRLVSTLTTTALLAFAVWRYGLVAGAVTLFVAVSAWPVYAFVRAHGFNLEGLTALAVLAAPLVLGAVSYRRFARE